MTRLPLAALAAALLAAAAGTARADSLALAFKGAIYQDDAEVPLRDPEGVACGDNLLVVADTGQARLVRFRLREGMPIGAAVTKLEQLKQPTAVQLDEKGDLWVLDRRARKIGRVGSQGTGSFEGWLEVKASEGGPPVEPIAFKVAGPSIVLIDAASRRVLFVEPGGTVVRQVPLPKGEFTDLAVDAAGTLYAVEAVDAVVWSVERTGTAMKALTRSLKDVVTFPGSLTATDRGLLAVGDKHGHGIVLLGADGTFLGRQLDMGPKEGVLYYPTALCMGTGGDLFVADRGNNRVQVFRTQR